MKNKISKKHYLLHGLLQLFILLLIIPVVYNFFPIEKGNSTFYLPHSTSHTLIDTLEQHGYNVSLLDSIILKPLKIPPEGWYHITDIPNKRWDFFEQLETYKTKTIRVKIYAGENTQELTKRLANDLKLNQDKLLKAYHSQSKYVAGDILSGFYRVSRKADEESIINALFALSNKKLKKFTQRYCDTNPNELEFKILLIIASIIQKETNNPKEMSLISSVIENRLEKGMRLQMDSTLNYGQYSHQIVTSSRIKEDKSYYNTYKYSGIPPSPLCSISLDALESALNPAKTDYIYFMLNKKGLHDFSSSYEQHKKNIQAFRKIASPKVTSSISESNITIETKEANLSLKTL
jgi:UPF0755 protein